MGLKAVYGAELLFWLQQVPGFPFLQITLQDVACRKEETIDHSKKIVNWTCSQLQKFILNSYSRKSLENFSGSAWEFRWCDRKGKKEM